MPRAWLAALLLLAGAGGPAVAQQVDTAGSTQIPAPFFTRHDGVVAGGLTLASVALLPFDKRITHAFRGERLQGNRLVSNGATVFRVTAVPGALIIGPSLYAAGRLAHSERLADLGLHGTEAVAFAAVTTFVVKGAVGRSRPYVTADRDAHDFRFGRGYVKGDDYSSFPSGHTAAAFAAAAAVTSETRRWSPRTTVYVAPVMYGGATLVGLSRLYNDKHWASDVVMAAAIGILSGQKVVQYQHAHPANRINRWLLPSAVAPAGTGGVALAWTIQGQP